MRDRAAKQQALIVSALKLFASKGYDATTTREIASCADCAEGLIHRYFRGKAGLLSALIKDRISREVADLAHHIPPARCLKDEYLQLVDWAVEHMWADREFLRVALPRAVLDPIFGRALRRVGPQQQARALTRRLRQFKECKALTAADLDALIQLVTVLGFMFGFMRPAVLRQDRESAASHRQHTGQTDCARPPVQRGQTPGIARPPDSCASCGSSLHPAFGVKSWLAGGHPCACCWWRMTFRFNSF